MAGRQPHMPRLVGGRRGGGPSSVAPRSRNPQTGRNKFRVHMFCYPVQYESFEQLVGVAEQGDRSEALRNGWVLSGLQ